MPTFKPPKTKILIEQKVNQMNKNVSENFSGVKTRNSRQVFYSRKTGVNSPTFENTVNYFHIRNSQLELLIFSVFREYMYF
jgi:hypothetical protein